MPLSSGARLGPHEILAAIGARGSGWVCAARDARPDRRLAPAIVSPAISADPDRGAERHRLHLPARCRLGGHASPRTRQVRCVRATRDIPPPQPTPVEPNLLPLKSRMMAVDFWPGSPPFVTGAVISVDGGLVVGT